VARVQTIVQLTDDLVEQLDEEAARRGCSPSALIREAVIAHLASSSERAAVQRYVEGYRRFPPGDKDEWGDLAGELDRAASETLRRLDAEEQAADQRW
jgi:hypothetical protein